jgi:hypothetical protein
VPKPTAIIQVVLKGQVDSYLKDIPKFNGKTVHHVHDYGQLAAELESKGYKVPSIAKETVEAKAREYKII